MDNTIYVSVSGGIVNAVYTDKDFKARINVVVMDLDNDGCECGGADPHSHETYELQPVTNKE